MRPYVSFQKERPEFWALVRYLSAQLGYTDRTKTEDSDRRLLRYDYKEVEKFTQGLGIESKTIERVCTYLNYRADVLETKVKEFFMNRAEAKKLFNQLKKKHRPTCNLPFNKQKGTKRHLAYFTCIINTLTQYHLNGADFVDNPGQLAIVRDPRGKLVATLSRRIDGAYPALDDPAAICEVKEYYGTTTFGSRVADAVYETQLDGYEINEAEKLASRRIEHYLLVDDRYTWWDCGRSYLCRLLDAMHMGLVDEVIFGREVLDRWPEIVRGWLKKSPSK